MKRVRRMTLSEWERSCAERPSLPAACDRGFAESLRAIPEYDRPAIPFAIEGYSDEPAIVVAYPRGRRPLDSATLSPLGLGAAFFSGAPIPADLSPLDFFIQDQSIRWRSIGLSSAPYWPAGLRLTGTGDSSIRSSTHVLDLDADYATLFTRKFKGATRTCIRRSESGELTVERASDIQTVKDYYRVHEKLAGEKGGYEDIYPEALFLRLFELCPRFSLVVARNNGDVVAGCVLLDDGPSSFYWHAAADRALARLQPAYAVLSHSIRLAIAAGKTCFNFGASAGIQSLIAFKESWGARPVDITSEVHRHPLIATARSLAARAHL